MNTFKTALLGSLFVLGSLVVSLRCQANPISNTLAPFSTDGCSQFVEGTPNHPKKWAHCCIQHDLFYWKGGTKSERKLADEFLRACVAKTGSPGIARAMYIAVRNFGGPCNETTYRWGYGWTYSHGYAPLTPSELELVQALTPQDVLATPMIKPKSYHYSFPSDQPRVACD